MDSHKLVPLHVLFQTRAVSYSEVAAVTLLTWDIFITFSDEVELIWKKAWTPAKGMYVFARYIPWLFQLALLGINIDGSTGIFFTVAECRKWMIVQAVILQLVITAVDIILILRVYILFNRNRYLLLVLGTLFLAEVAFLSYVLAMITPRLTFNDDCFVTSSPPLFTAYWIVSLIFETVLFVLTLIKFGEAIKGGWGRQQVMREFIADGTWAYTLIFVTMLVNSMLYKFVHSPLAGICFTWLLSVLSFAGSRIILNPRRRSNNRNSGRLTTVFELVNFPASPTTPISPWKGSTLPGSFSTSRGSSGPGSPLSQHTPSVERHLV